MVSRVTERTLSARAIAVCLTALFALSAGAPSSSPWSGSADPVFVHVDARGLPEEAVMSLAQDTNGFLWVGTQGGLARYDGYRFRNILPDPSNPEALPDGYVRMLLPGRHGDLWIGSSSSGLVRYDALSQTFRTWFPDPAGHAGPRSAEINALAGGPGGTLWVGGDAGLDRFDPAHGRFSPMTLAHGSAQPEVWTLLTDRSHAVWAGTQSGLYERPAAGEAFRPFRLGRGRPVIYSLYEDSSGTLWAGSANALYRIDRNRTHVSVLRSRPQDPRTLAPGQQWALIEPRPGTLWAGADDAISIIDESSGRVRRVTADGENPGGLTAGRVVRFVRGRSGLIWVANHIGGLLFYNPNVSGLYELSATRPDIGPGRSGGALDLATEPDGRLWAGGLGGALVELDPHLGRTRAVMLPNRAAVQALFREPDGALWIGTTNGLCRLVPSATHPVCPAGPAELGTPSIYALLGDGPRLWVGSSSGLLLADLRNGHVTAIRGGTRAGTLSNNQVRVLMRDHRGRLWVGTENGLNRIDLDGRITRFVFDRSNPEGIGPGGMTALLEDRRGRIWAGANGGPLELLVPQPNGSIRFRRMGRADGMPTDDVDGLAQDAAGTIWAATDAGIARIDPATLHIRALGLADGVSVGGFWAGSVAQGRRGTIFFGGLDGIAIIAPGAASPWTYLPPVVASALSIGRRIAPAEALAAQQRIALPARERDLSLEFAALDYSAPGQLRYEYKLAGYDRDWIQTDAMHRTATYTHLPPAITR